MKMCSKCKEKRKNRYFDPDRPKDVPDWCIYCAFKFVFLEKYYERKKHENRTKSKSNK